MSDTASISGITPRFTPRGARELIDDIDLLLDHLGRALPGRLEACFDDSRGSTARPASAADPPTPPDDAVGGAGVGARTKAAFLRHLADIADRSGRSAEAGGGRDASWSEFVPDLVFLIQSRDFLATLVQAATVDTIRLTRAYVDETIRPRKPAGRRPRTASAAAPGAPGLGGTGGRPSDGLGAPRNHTDIGIALAKRMRLFRQICLGCVVATLLLSLHAFAGKVLLDERERTVRFLGEVTTDIEKAADERATTSSALFTAAARGAGHVATYCDAPFLDDEGVVRYVSTRQEVLCNRLWGVNEEVNRLNNQVGTWTTPFVRSPLGWFFGVTTLHSGSFGLLGQADGEPVVRRFTENARAAGYVDALELARQRGEAARSQRPEGGGAPRADTVIARGATPNTGSGEEAPPAPPAGVVPDPAVLGRIVKAAGDWAIKLNYRPPSDLRAGRATPLQARAVIEGVGLYAMPCLYAVLGAFVAVFRNIAAKSDASLLDRSDLDRATQTVMLGLVFGAVVGLIADVLRAGGAAAPSPGTTVTLGVSALALLAGYSVGHVFGLLDDISERVFGRRASSGATAR
ncbi:hypothetical protein [Belnapia moabensis]|uniref:hypothetical protein n=1 Tax=Belnapia moabensis TaxID=365533 RepID=UPI0005BBFD62|nr:hypothetical protein [Belnapia moabensis]